MKKSKRRERKRRNWRGRGWREKGARRAGREKWREGGKVKSVRSGARGRGKGVEGEGRTGGGNEKE